MQPKESYASSINAGFRWVAALRGEINFRVKDLVEVDKAYEAMKKISQSIEKNEYFYLWQPKNAPPLVTSTKPYGFAED